MKFLRTGVAVLLLAGIAFPPARSEESRRAFQIADYYRTVFPNSPAISADGDRIVFAVRRYNLEEARTWSELWMMKTDGTDLRQLTFSHHNDVAPQFTPDGKRILFMSDRDGNRTQVFELSLDEDDPEKLTTFSMGITSYRISPDGRHLAVAARVYPECGADSECNSRIARKMEGRLQVHVADSLLYRHWDFWRDGTCSHILLADARNGKILRDLTPGAFESPTFSLDPEPGYAFSPDGSELCYVSNHDPDPASSTNADLWIVPIKERNGAGAVNITAQNRGWDGTPVYSPDGRYIGYRSQATPGFESDLFRLAVYDRNAKTTLYLTDASNYDNWVTALAWDQEPGSLLFQGEYHARNPIYRISLGDRKPVPLLTDGAIVSWKTADAGSTVVYERRTINAPPEILRFDSKTGRHAQLTNFNEELVAEVDLRAPEEIWVQGAGDYKVHVFVIKPHGFDPAKKYPLILNVHGGPQSQWMDTYRGDWQVYPGKDYVVAFANPTGSTGYGQDFTDAISKDWGGRVFKDLMLVTDALENLPYVDKERMGSMGWSFGGYMMMWFEGHTTRFRTSAAMMGVYNLTSMYGSTDELWFPEWDLGGTPWDSELYRKWSPSEYVKNFKTPCLVITGERDFRVPYTQSLEFFTALQKMGVPSRLIVYRNAGHWPDWYEMAFYYNAHLDWFHRWLGGGQPPYDLMKFARNSVFD